MSDGIRDMVSRGPLALRQPEALNAAVCLGVQIGWADWGLRKRLEHMLEFQQL